MPQELVTDLSVILPSVLLTVMLTFFVMTDTYIGKAHRKVLLIVCALIFGLIAQNYSDMLLQGRYVNIPLRMAVSIIGYTLRPMILVLFCYVVNPSGRFRAAWTLAAVNAAIYLTACFSRLTFWISEANHYQGGPLRFTCLVISIVLLFYLLFLSVRRFRTTGARNNWVPMISVFLIIGSIILDGMVGSSLQPVTFLTAAVVLNSCFYYVWLHLQFVYTHEQELKAGQRIQIMKTQIQPHFLFNTLNTIRAVYTMNPPLADQTLEKFSKYLRQNLDAMEQPDLIPFTREMEHTRLYADIEMLRFPHIRMEYRIDDDDFAIPALSVQPLVENAIRHGVRSREEGIVTISSYRDENSHVIEIRDNGTGFDPNAQNTPGETHIGIENVRNRVERLCGGSLSIDSKVGQGTAVTLTIPISGTGEGKELRA